jgi:predicted RNase H-like HicB family nuclease
MLQAYIKAAMRKAVYEIIEDDASFFGRIPGFEGLWANHKTLEGCRDELESALEDWLLVGVSLHHELPVVEGLDLNQVYSQAIAA